MSLDLRGVAEFGDQFLGLSPRAIPFTVYVIYLNTQDLQFNDLVRHESVGKQADGENIRFMKTNMSFSAPLLSQK